MTRPDRLRARAPRVLTDLLLALLAVLTPLLGCSCGNGGTVVNATPAASPSPSATVAATPTPVPRWDNPWANAVVGEWAIYDAGKGADGAAIEDYCEVTAVADGTVTWSRKREGAGTSQAATDSVKLDAAGSEWFRRSKDDAKPTGTEKIDLKQGEAAVTLECEIVTYTTEEGTVRIWFSPAFPLDGVVKEERNGTVIRTATYFDIKPGE